MTRADIREAVKMQLSIVDPNLPGKFSNSFLNTLIERAHRDIIIKARALRKGSDTELGTTDITDLTTEQLEELQTELGEDILTSGFDSYIDLDNVEQYYKLISIRKSGEKLGLLKYEHISDTTEVDDYTSDTMYYEAANNIFFVNGTNITVNLYYYATPATITSDTQELELREEFIDAVIYNILKKIAISTKGLTYEIIAYEYKEALREAKDYYRAKNLDGTGQIIFNDY